MSLSTFRINQPPGTPYADYDRSRRDIDLYSVASEKVECEAQNTSETTYLWEMESAPDGVSVTINNPTTNTCDFEVDTTGGYLIRLTVNAGLVTESITTLYFGVPLENLGICLPALNETNHDNSQSPNDGARGSEDKINALLRQVDVLAEMTSWPEDSVVFVERGATDLLSGTALLAAWTAVKALTPGGNALSATNKGTLIIPPGTYDIGSNVWDLDASYIDVIGFGECRRAPVTGAYRADPLVVIAGSGTSVVTVSTSYHSLSGIRVEQSDSAKHGIIISTTSPYVSFTDMSVIGSNYGSSGFSWHATVNVYAYFVRCHVSTTTQGSFFYDESIELHGVWEDCVAAGHSWKGDFYGRATRCIAQGYSFTVRGQDAVCSGTFEDCIAGDYSFGRGGNPNTYSIAVSGTFKNCIGGDWSFGSVTTSSGPGLVVSGEFDNCQATRYSFGFGGKFSGIAHNCTAGIDSFGSVDFSGEAYDCVADQDSFGDYSFTGGKLVRCTNINRTHALNIDGGYMEACTLAAVSGGSNPLIYADSSTSVPVFYNCTLIASTAQSTIDDTADIKMAHCRLNNNIGSGITNLIGSGYNIVDSDVTE